VPISSGQVVTAEDLNRLKPTTYRAVASANLVGIVADTDITGATITLTTETDNAVFVCTGVFDMDWQGAAAVANVIVGKLFVDGVQETAQALAEQAAGANGDRISTSQTWRGTLATAGSHTLKLVGTVPDADQKINSTHTTITVTIYEVV
jgi:hypothetical protein